MGAVAGFLGSVRWQATGDASALEAMLSQAGFFFLVVVAMFEVNVSPKAFLEEKLMITSWFLQKMGYRKILDFPIHEYSPELLHFLSTSEVSHMYEEYDGKMKITQSFFNFNFSMHMLGAGGYVVLVTASIIINDWHEMKVAWITGISFIAFCALGYFTGTYFPIFPCFRGVILLWNPFLREPDFLIRLQRVRSLEPNRCRCFFRRLRRRRTVTWRARKRETLRFPWGTRRRRRRASEAWSVRRTWA